MFLVGFVLFCLAALHPMNKSLYKDGLSRQEIIGHHFLMNFSKIDHSYEAFTYLFGRNNSTPLPKLKKIVSNGKFRINP